VHQLAAAMAMSAHFDASIGDLLKAERNAARLAPGS
jgi:hypothetical protein